MGRSADLEIEIDRRSAEYVVALRFSAPGSDTEAELVARSPLHVDFVALRALQHDVRAYGSKLAELLFAAPGVGEAFARARAACESARVALRVRLLLASAAAELHNLRWETLRSAGDREALLFDGQNVLFSRYVTSTEEYGPMAPRPRSALRALVAIASPSDVGSYARRADQPLAAVDVDAELTRARRGLAPVQVVALASGGAATLNGIVQKLRDGFDILYLVCHGVLGDEPHLLLENDDGSAAPVACRTLADRLKGLREGPRLVVLASCQSAGHGGAARADDDGALVALGPLLARSGVPAVVAMQGNVSMATAGRFTAAFFGELCRSGEVDGAMAAARGSVRDAEDWWMPVLFMRLRSGRLWQARAHWHRLVLAAPVVAVAVAGTAFALDIAGAQRAGCQLPGVRSACAAYGLGGVPTRAERELWGSRPRGDCRVLKIYLERFPGGAFASEAASRLQAARTEEAESWRPGERRLPLHVRAALEPFASQAAARTDAVARGEGDAHDVCAGYGAGEFRLRSAESAEPRVWRCSRRLGGWACGFDGLAICRVDVREVVRREVCG